MVKGSYPSAKDPNLKVYDFLQICVIFIFIEY